MRIVVIGAGIAGLGAASFLARAGHSVRVLEGSSRVAGRAMSLEHRGDRCDVGTQYYHSSYTRALALIRDADLGDTLATIRGSTRFFDPAVRAGSYRVHHRLPWIRGAGLRGNLALGAFMLRALIRHPMDPFALEDHPELDGQRALDAITSPAVREYAVRNLHLAGGLAEPEPAEVSLLQALRLMRIIVLTDYLALSGGVASLHEALARRLDVRLEAPVARLVVEGDVCRGVELASGETADADHVVVAVPGPRVTELLPEEWTVEREFTSGVRMPPALIVSLFLDRPLEQGVWSYMLPPRSGCVSFCTDASQKSPAMVPSGNALLQAWICYPSSGELAVSPDGDVIAACLRDLDPFFPRIAERVEHAHVTRHAAAVPWHPAGHHTRALRFLASADRRPGVSFCGDYLSGGYLEPALWSAERAAARIAGAPIVAPAAA